MLCHTGNAKANAGIRTERNLNARIMERLQVLLVGCDGCAVSSSRGLRKRALAIRRIIQERTHGWMQRALEEWLAHPGGLLRKGKIGVIKHDGGDVPKRARLHHIDELGVNGLVTNTVSNDVTPRPYDRLSVIEVEDMGCHTQAVLVRLVDHRHVDFRRDFGWQ